MKLKDRVKIECLKQGMTLRYIASKTGITTHNYYFHLNKENEVIIRKTEKILNLENGFFK